DLPPPADPPGRRAGRRRATRDLGLLPTRARHDRRAPRGLRRVVTDRRPEVLFVSVHNAGRSQMAAALVTLRSGGHVGVRAAGRDRAGEVNPVGVDAMAEVGVDLSGAFPKRLEDEAVRAADVVVTMGCGDACPVYPGKRYEDWQLDDPAGQDLEVVRRIRD